jgi:alpha-1,6-mannosyltransferase
MHAPTLPADAPRSARPTGEIGLRGVVVVGVVGAVALAWGTWQVGALADRRFRLRWLDDAPLVGAIPLPSRFVGYVLWIAGVALLSAAWVLLRRRTATAGHGLTLGTVAAIAGLWMLPLLLAPPIGSRDVYSYVAHGELAAQGADPGEVAPVALGLTSPVLQAVDPVWRNVVSAYGPLNTGVAEAAVRVADHDVERSVILWRLVAIGGVALLGVGVVALARGSGKDPVDALALAVAGPLTIVQLVGGPHNEALMIGLMAVGVAVGTTRSGRGAWIAGAALCGLGAAVKAPALLGAAYVGWVGPLDAQQRDERWPSRFVRTAVAGAISLAVIAATSVVAGVGWGWLGGLSAGSNVTSLLSVSTTLGLIVAWVLQQPLRLGPVVTGVRDLFLGASLAVAGVVLWRSPKLGLAALAVALLAVGVLGPAVHPWYLAWCLPAAAVVLAGRPARWAMAIAIVAAASTRPMGGGIVRNLGYFPVPMILVLAALGAGGWWLTRGSGRRRTEAPPSDPTPASW